MCGIAGLYNLSGAAVDKNDVQIMNRQLHHRGPDEEGYYIQGPVGFGMSRLSVIDVARGHQPMATDDGNIQLIFNGEIYNHRNLKSSLESDGYRFSTNSDTEVLLRLYEKWDLDFLRHLRGMFAIALWDAKKNRLLLARDRLGKKPLVYSMGKDQIAWSSELASLMKAPHISKEINPIAIDLYLGLQYIPSPQSIYSSVKKIPPAHYLLIENGQTRLSRYWSLPSLTNTCAYSYQESKQLIKDKITEAVKIRMESDVPLGAFLSGGIDSTLIVGLMSQLTTSSIKTFSIGFQDEKYSELDFSREASQFFKTDHSEFIVKPEMIEAMNTLVNHYGEPYGDSSALATYYLARETRKKVTVSLSGDGGDEVFGGYYRYSIMNRIQSLDLIPKPMWIMLEPLISVFSQKGSRFINNYVATSLAERYANLINVFNQKLKWSIYSNDFLDHLNRIDHSLNYLTDNFLIQSSPDLINTLSRLDLITYLPECLMVKVDIASMANSLEVRSPLLDHELVELLATMPGEWKAKGFFSTKKILKDSFGNFLPERILTRPKMGFGLPVHDWFRGALKDFCRDTLFSSAALNRGYFDKHNLEKLFFEHISLTRNHGYQLWSLVMLELWHQSVSSQHN